ncbi:MAG: glycosyltransferase family 9 protein, partial [Flavobacteriales bacterium]
MAFKFKVLIIRFSSIGDIVLTTPVIRCLKKQIKSCEIHFLTKEPFWPLLENNPHIDQIHTIKESPKEMIDELKEKEFDQIIDLHKNLRSRYIRKKLKCDSYDFPKLNWEKWLMVNFKINKLPTKHIVHRYFKAVENLHVKYDGKGLDIFLNDMD